MGFGVTGLGVQGFRCRGYGVGIYRGLSLGANDLRVFGLRVKGLGLANKKQQRHLVLFRAF